MYNSFLRSFFLLILGAASVTSSAQNNGCDGARYIQDVFPAFKKTTVPYCTATSHAGTQMTLSLDLYEPEGDVLANRPVVILAHGGSFIAGDRTNMRAYCEQLAKKGYVAATISYRLYPFLLLGYPDSLDIMDTAIKAYGDMKAAIRYFREDAAGANKWRIHPELIFAGGYSAGAVTALHVGLMDSGDVLPDFVQAAVDANGGFNGNSGSANNQSFSSDIKAVLNMSGALYRQEWIDADNTPFYSIHGTADATVQYLSGLAANIMYLEGSGLLHPKATEVGLDNHLLTVQGAGHTNLYDPNNVDYKDDLAAFWLDANTRMEDIICNEAPVPTDELTVNTQSAWSIYPNPASDVVYLKLPENTQSVNATFYNALGQVVLSLHNVQNGTPVATKHLGTGIFMVTIQDEANPQSTFPCVKISH